MADNYVSEQEQLETIRKWWDENGKAILIGLALGLSALFGYRYWNQVEDTNAETASVNYQHFLQMVAAGPSDEARSTGQAILEGYPKSAYARLTALLLARLAVDDKKFDEAKKHLNWVITHGKGTELAAVAHGRLAQLLLAEGKTAEAAAMLDKIPALTRDKLFIELRADVLAAQGNKDAAYKLYTAAIDSLTKLGANADYLEMKRDALGVTATAAAAK